MAPRAAASPARARVPAAERVTRSAGKPPAVGAATDADGKTAAFYHSLCIYLGCVSTLGVLVLAVLSQAPPAPAGGVCDGVGLGLLFGMPTTEKIVRLWSCAKAYQAKNWWFVLCLFELVYVGLKMFALPVAFSLCILGGAIFPIPVTQALTSMGETVGSSLCYLLSSAIARPILEHLAPERLETFRKRAREEREHMFLFNLFLRFSPVPNWLVNAASPVVGNPFHLFVAGTFFGTQISLCFLAVSGSTLRTVRRRPCRSAPLAPGSATPRRRELRPPPWAVRLHSSRPDPSPFPLRLRFT